MVNSKIKKIITAVVLSVAFLLVPAKSVMADEISDAIAAQQAAVYQQQLAAIQAYQAALLAQYQQAIADQYAKSLLVFQEAQAEQQRAVQQAYMLNAIQQKQQAQYESMIKSTGLDYQQYLLNEYNKYQKQAIAAFKGYEGLK